MIFSDFELMEARVSSSPTQTSTTMSNARSFFNLFEYRCPDCGELNCTKFHVTYAPPLQPMNRHERRKQAAKRRRK